MFVVQIESNIGISKSTFINYLKKRFKDLKKLNVKFIDKSVSDWMNIDGCNLLDLYHKNPKKYGELFQFNVFLTTLRKCLKENYKNIDIVIMERSLHTTIHCFNKLLLDKKLVDSMCHTVLKKALELFDDKILQPDIIIYFEINNKDIPLILQKRIRERKREGETHISNDYLIKLNNIYEDVMKNTNNKIYTYKPTDSAYSNIFFEIMSNHYYIGRNE